MRKDGLTTAKMLAIATGICIKHCKKYEQKNIQEHGRESVDAYCEEKRKEIRILRKLIAKGISRKQLIESLENLGYKEITAFLKKTEALDHYNEMLENVHDDNSLEDDGTSFEREEREDVGFVGLGQIEAEERENKQAAE